MPLEQFMGYPNDEYHQGITLQEWGGSYWLISSRKLDDGRVMHEWVHPSRDRKPIEKALPWKIKIGDSKEEAMETLRYFAKFLK